MPALDDELEHRPDHEDQHGRHQEQRQRRGTGRERRDDRGDDVAQVAGQEIGQRGIEEERDQEGAADNRHREQELDARIGDEADDDERPVGGGDQRAALQGGLQPRSLLHGQTPHYTSCILRTSVLSQWFATSVSRGASRVPPHRANNARRGTGSRRCPSLRYSRHPRSSRRAIRAPRLRPRSTGTGH